MSDDLTAKEIAQLVDDLRMARRDLTEILNKMIELTGKLTDLVVVLIRAVR